LEAKTPKYERLMVMSTHRARSPWAGGAGAGFYLDEEGRERGVVDRVARQYLGACCHGDGARNVLFQTRRRRWLEPEGTQRRRGIAHEAIETTALHQHSPSFGCPCRIGNITRHKPHGTRTSLREVLQVLGFRG